MLKKILAVIILFVVSLSTGFASGSFYLGPGITYADVRSSDLTYNALMPALYVGYGAWRSESLFLALEGFATSKSIRTTDNDDANTILKMSYNYGLSVVPMMSLDNAIFGFLRLGFVRTKFPNLGSIENAYQLGLGLEGVLVGCWNLRGEADYVKYGSVKKGSSDSDIHVGSLHAAEYTLALIYRFDSLLG